MYTLIQLLHTLIEYNERTDVCNDYLIISCMQLLEFSKCFSFRSIKVNIN